VSASSQAYEQYRSSLTYEWMLRIGDPRTPPIMFVPPLLEELNRTRALIVTVMRRLAANGSGCWLPDLSGSGESLLPLQSVSWSDWGRDVRAAAAHVRDVSGKPPAIASIRGGALIDSEAEASCRWRFAPVAGRALARELDRASLAGGADWAGYPASIQFKDELAAAVPGEASPLRVVRLETDAGAADHKLAGPALWRRSEPGNSVELASALAADINEWARACAAS